MFKEKNEIKIQVLIINLLFYLSFSFCSGQHPTHDGSLDRSLQEFRKAVDSLVTEKMSAYNIPGLSIGIVKDHAVIYAKGYGLKNINSNNTVNEKTIFHTASISKLFTAQAIMMLVDKELLSLEDPVSTLIPKLQYKDKKIARITIKSLLNHTAGLQDIKNYHWKNNKQSEYSLEQYILGTKLKLRSDPKTEYYYSNLGYNLLGYVIQKLSKINFDVFMREQILKPCQMHDSDFRYYKIPEKLKSSPHSRRVLTKKIYQRRVYPYTREQAPSSTLNSSALDLSNWMISFLKKLDDSSTESSFKQMIKSSCDVNTNIGLGFQLTTIYHRKIIGHYGGDKGYRSYLIMVPEEKIGLVLLANCDYQEDFRQEILHPILKQVLN